MQFLCLTLSFVAVLEQIFPACVSCTVRSTCLRASSCREVHGIGPCGIGGKRLERGMRLQSRVGTWWRSLRRTIQQTLKQDVNLDQFHCVRC